MQKLRQRVSDLNVQFRELSNDTNYSLDIIHMLRSNIDGISYITLLMEDQYNVCLNTARLTYSRESPPQEDLFKLIDEIAKLSVFINTLFFYIRSFQDNLYRLILEKNKEANWGIRCSMKKALSTEHGKWISSNVPEYKNWFSEFREIRNNIKTGVFSSGGSWNKSTEELSFTYTAFEKEGRRIKGGYVFTLDKNKIIESVDMSTKLLTAIFKN